MSIRYAIRKPYFPVIVSVGDRVFAAMSPSALQKVIRRESLYGAELRLLDSTWEWFELLRDINTLAPSFMDRLPPTKQALIELVNFRNNRAVGSPSYQPRSLSGRSREDVFAELIALLSAA